MIRGARAAKSAPSWQDLRAVYPPTAICRAFRIHGTHILPKPARFGCMACESCQEGAIFLPEATFGMHGAQNLPRIAARERIAREYCHCQSGQECIRAQSCRRRTLGGRTAREYCHYQSPGNAFRAYPAIVERPRTQRGKILPLPVARECTASAYRHCQSPVTQRSPRGGVSSVPWLCCGGSARNTFRAREWTFRLLGA